MAAFLDSIKKMFGSTPQPPSLHLAAFGKHPGWNDHMDDLGFDTDSLVNVKRLLYSQGISQNIDSGAWDKIEPTPPGSAPSEGRLADFRHDFLWQMPAAPASILLAGRLWSSVDGKGRDKYPMVLTAQVSDIPNPIPFATQIVLPFLAQLHERCAAATTAAAVRDLHSSQRDALRNRIADPVPPRPLTTSEFLAVANHPDMHPNKDGFFRIVYQFITGMSLYRPLSSKSSSRSFSLPRAEQVRLPSCGLLPKDALLFWLRFALSILDPNTSILLFTPDQILSNPPPALDPPAPPAAEQVPAPALAIPDPALVVDDESTVSLSPAAAPEPAAAAPPEPLPETAPTLPPAPPPPPGAPWVDLIVGEPAPSNLFCIKAGTRALPFTSDIPYTLDPSFIRTLESFLATCASPPDSPLPPWPV